MQKATPPKQRGFTLLELLIVMAIVAISSIGVGFSMRDTADAKLELDAQRLIAILESARAQSRTTGMAVSWHTNDKGFVFTGLAKGAIPTNWLNEQTRALPDASGGHATLQLGPEPIIANQSVFLVSNDSPNRTIRIQTDGVHPFHIDSIRQ